MMVMGLALPFCAVVGGVVWGASQMLLTGTCRCGPAVRLSM
jgi:hypothetical protein